MKTINTELGNKMKEDSFHYIKSIIYNIGKGILIIEFIKDPNGNVNIIRKLIFQKVKNLSDKISFPELDEEIWTEEQNELILIDSLIGLVKMIDREEIQYEIVTEIREIDFTSNEESIIEDVSIIKKK